jgi:hypothetical protein
MTIGELLIDANKPENNRKQLEFYYNVLPAGKIGNHVGSYLVSEWWRRNMIIYENILKSLTGKEKRILVIFGQGHTALLQEMIRYNADFKIRTPADILK